MTVIEELNGFIHTMRLKDREGGYLTVQDARRWARETREMQDEISALRGDLAGIELMDAEGKETLPEVVRQLQEEADDSARVAGELAAENVLLKERIEALESRTRELRYALAIAEAGGDPLREA